MYLSAERLALVNQQVQETFEQTCVAWQAIPQWDMNNAGATKVRSDVVYANKNAGGGAPVGVGPIGAASLPVISRRVGFFVTLAQASAPTPDAMLAAVTARTAELAAEVDAYVLFKLFDNVKLAKEELAATGKQDLLDELIDARVRVENAGFRAPSALFTNKEGLKKLSYLDGSYSVLPAILDAANINSFYRVRSFADPGAEPAAEPAADSVDISETAATKVQMVVLGRRQLIAQGGAPSASPGEEPIDLAVSIYPGLDVVGETVNGNIELVVHIQFALRIKDVRGLIAVVDET